MDLTMDLAMTALASLIKPPKRRGHPALARMATALRRFAAVAFQSYHPERHYMRGPGPACAAKRCLDDRR